MSSFSKTSVFTRPHVNTKTAFSKTSVFTRLHVNTKTAFSKTSTLESVFENLRFRHAKTPFTCGRNAKTEKKTSVFKNIRIRVDGALITNSQKLALKTILVRERWFLSLLNFIHVQNVFKYSESIESSHIFFRKCASNSVS